jgi:ATP-dependent Clp endopeptidase proteolytic subunit ClpP
VNESSQLFTSSSEIILLQGEITEEKSAFAIEKLLGGHIEQRPLHLVLSTYGGSVVETFGIYDVMKYVRRHGSTIYTLGVGKVMSAGVLLLAAGSRGCREIGKNCRLMFHAMTTEADGKLSTVVGEIKETKRHEEQFTTCIRKESSAPFFLTRQLVSQWNESATNVYLSPKQAIYYGLVDKCLE